MRTTERLRMLADWTYKSVCKGRKMKTPATAMDISQIVRQEPKVYIAYYPMREDHTAWAAPDALNTAPSILIMPTASYAKYMEEQRFDRYNNVHRPKELGQQLSVQTLFSVYEDGVRMPGFIDKLENGEMDMSLIKEGTEDGLQALFNWMDDYVQALIGAKIIPHTDLQVNEASMSYTMYTDQKYVNDKRPLFYGIVNVSFQCYAEEKLNREIQRLLD